MWERVDAGTTQPDSENVDEESGPCMPDDECCVPCPRSGHAMVYNESNHSLIVFGGRKSKNADGDMNDLWEFNIETNGWMRIK